MKLFRFLGLLATTALLVNTAYASITLQQTRVIIPPGENEGTITVTGPKTTASLVQSWLTDKDGKELNNFTASPPATLIKEGANQIIRVIAQGQGMPTDRESMFFLNIQDVGALPGDAQQKNTVTPSFTQTVKVFYRPKALDGKSTDDAPLDLKWTITDINDKDYKVTLENPSPFHITFQGIALTHKSNASDKGNLVATNPDFETIAPMSKVDLVFKRNPKQATTQANALIMVTITDFGTNLLYHGDIQDNMAKNIKLYTPTTPRTP